MNTGSKFEINTYKEEKNPLVHWVLELSTRRASLLELPNATRPRVIAATLALVDEVDEGS